jgi:hypothetical protein
VRRLLEVLEDEAKAFPTALEMDPHNLFHAKLCGALTGHVGAIRAPLQKSATHLSSTLRKIPQNVTGTFAKLQALREQEQSKQ